MLNFVTYPKTKPTSEFPKKFGAISRKKTKPRKDQGNLTMRENSQRINTYFFFSWRKYVFSSKYVQTHVFFYEVPRNNLWFFMNHILSFKNMSKFSKMLLFVNIFKIFKKSPLSVDFWNFPKMLLYMNISWI